ncbi:MAG TPA: ribosome silencing factor [Methylomirabilota bacterium]|nr:ribosome silencing factor [Methylomirabilota bacterium]
MTPRSAEAVARLVARAALDKRAVDLVVLDLQGMSSLADFFLVCTGRSTAQMDTIAEAIAVTLRAEGIRVRHREGTAESGWLLLDYGDVVVHVFGEEARAFYGLERLWGDAPVLSVERGASSRD